MSLEKILKRGKNFFRKAAIISAFSLPFLYYGCKKDDEIIEEELEKPLQEIIQEKLGKTNSNGEIYFTDNSTLEKVTIEVIDAQNKPLSDIQINFTDGEGYEVFWLRDLSGKYLPTLGIFAHNSKHLIRMEESDKGISEIYTLDKNDSRGEVVLEWRNKESIGFSEYSYERTINYDEYLEIQERSKEVVDLLWKGIEILAGIKSPKKPSEIIEKLFPEEKNPPQRWDLYNYWDGQNGYFTLIPSNIPKVEIKDFGLNESGLAVFWEGTDKDKYEKFVFLPDNKDLTKYVDGNSTSDLKYSYRITQNGNVVNGHDWTKFDSKTSANINIEKTGNYTLELRVKDEVDNIGEISEDFIYKNNSSRTLDSIIIQPGPEGKDAFVKVTIWADGSETYRGYGDSSYLEVYKYSMSLSRGGETQSLIEFPRSSIPSNIVSAKFELYGQGASAMETAKVDISEITSSWDESSVKLSTKPSYGKVIATSILNDKKSWHKWDVTSLVQDWAKGKPNYGMAITTNIDRPRGEFAFVSSDNLDAEKWPRLIIYYEKQNE